MILVDIQTPEASIPKTVQNFMQSYSCEVTETQEMEFLDKNQQHKGKFVISHQRYRSHLLKRSTVQCFGTTFRQSTSI